MHRHGDTIHRLRNHVAAPIHTVAASMHGVAALMYGVAASMYGVAAPMFLADRQLFAIDGQIFAANSRNCGPGESVRASRSAEEAVGAAFSSRAVPPDAHTAQLSTRERRKCANQKS